MLLARQWWAFWWIASTTGVDAFTRQYSSGVLSVPRLNPRRKGRRGLGLRLSESAPENTKKRVVVVGGGWAGFGAAKALSEAGVYDVTLLDASPNPGGLSAGWRTKSGRAVEAGIKGFWYSYPNIYSLVEKELGLDDVFTDWTRSSFFSPDGLQVEAPVLQREQAYPSPLGLFIHTRELFTSLPLADRASMMPLLYAILDHDRDTETYTKYDKMSAHELFKRFGVSRRLYEEFLKPILLVGLFAPPEELSAAVVLGMLYFYVLAHQPDFDVRWCRGSVSEKIFGPLVSQIQENGGQVRGGMFVCDVERGADGKVTAVVARDSDGGTSSFPADAVVSCISITGMKKLVSACPALASCPDLRRVMGLRSVDVMATRLWFDRKVEVKNPSNVMAGFDDTLGGTFFHLNDLQDEYRDSPGSVVAADFYHASELLPLSDEQVVERLHKEFLSTCVPEFRQCEVVDSWVGRFPQAVTCFSPGSYPKRPTQRSSGIPNLFLAGDWVKGVDHGANGLSQERAYVTGLTAANLVMDQLGGVSAGRRAEVLQTEPDEPQVVLGKRVNGQVKDAMRTLGLQDPILDLAVFPGFLP